MPSGIILSSGSQGATQEQIEKVLADNGYEAETPAAEAPTELVEPKREDFQTEEEFKAAVDAHEAEIEKQEDTEEQKREEEERKRLDALPRKSRRQRAIEKATRDLEAENRRLKEQLEGKGGEGKKAAAEAAPAEELKVPKREDFANDEEFEEAKFQYRYKKQRQQEQTEDSKKAIENHQREMLSNYAAVKDEIKEEYDDWDDVLKKFGDSPVSSSVYVAILSLEEGPRVSYYLAKHPDELDKLNALFPDQATREVIRLHDRLKTKTPAAATSEKPKPRTRLPEPVKPVSTAATASTLSSREAAKNRDFKAFKRAQFAGR